LVATATSTAVPYNVVTRTPRPANRATADHLQALATANAILTGTPTPTPPNLVTATFTPRPTRTPVLVWLDEITTTPAPTPTPTPTTPPIPAVVRGKIAFLSERGGQVNAYILDPNSGRVALLTSRWPYDLALQAEGVSPDGQAWAYVQNDGTGRPQVFIHSEYYGGSWQVTFTTGMSYDPVWSPLGDTLAFVSTESGNDDIYVIGIDGQGQRRLTFNQWEWDKHPSWSPDGSQIVFWSNEGTGRRQLWIMDADGNNRRILLDSPYNDWDPVWIK
jgi:Tol biopolymer transport system component